MLERFDQNDTHMLPDAASQPLCLQQGRVLNRVQKLVVQNPGGYDVPICKIWYHWTEAPLVTDSTWRMTDVGPGHIRYLFLGR